MAMYPVFYDLTPMIYDHNKSYLNSNPSRHLLNYNGPGSAQTGRNRRAAIRNYVRGGGGRPPAGHSLDKFPYASTQQGGLGAAVTPVRIPEQVVQGVTLSLFYRFALGGRPLPFEVVLVPGGILPTAALTGIGASLMGEQGDESAIDGFSDIDSEVFGSFGL